MKKFASLLLTAVLLATMLSVFAVPAAATITANAETPAKKTMNMGGSVIANGDPINSKWDYIYYGDAKKWRVLSTNGNTIGEETATYKDDNGNKIEGPLFVISENDFGERAFNSNNTQNWQRSDAQNWCKGGFYTAAGITTDIEKAAILQTSKSDTKYLDYIAVENILKNDKVFYLSAKEAATYFNSDDDRIFIIDDAADEWWLRSPHRLIVDSVSIVPVDYYDFQYASDPTIASRPAFNLNLSSVLFTSAAEGGKSSSAGGELSEISAIDNDGKPYEWKLTLKDSEKYKYFAIFNGARSGDTLTVAYAGAETGANEKISYIITDKDQKEIKYYGNQAATSASGSIDITLPLDVAETDRLFVFNEQDNGAKKTNYASELMEVENIFEHCEHENLKCARCGRVISTYSATPTENTASTLSEGSLTIIVGVAVAVIFGLSGFILGTKKKKKPALASGKETDEE